MGGLLKASFLFFLGILPLACGPQPSPLSSSPYASLENEHQWRPLWDGHSWIVSFEGTVSPQTFKGRILQSFSKIQGALGSHLTNETFIKPLSPQGVQRDHLFALVALPNNNGLSFSKQKNLLETSLGVVRAEPNLKSRFYRSAPSQWPQPSQVPTSQPTYLEGYDRVPTHQQHMKLPQALEKLRRLGVVPKPVSIAVLDTAINFKHPNLEGVFSTLPGQSTPMAFDATTGTFVDIAQAKIPPAEATSHGTHVAALIAGQPAPFNGVLGICPTCQLIPVQVAKSSAENSLVNGAPTDGEITDADQLQAFETILNLKNSQGVPVTDLVSMSYGKAVASWALDQSMASLTRLGVVLVAAAGNENSSLPSYPAASPGVIAVAGAQWDPQAQLFRKSWFSNWGGWVRITTPSEDIISAASTGPTQSKSLDGTSQAAPLMTGAVGLVLSAYRDTLTPQQAAQRVLSTANAGLIYNKATGSHVYSGEVNGAKFALLGSGMVDLEAALEPPAEPSPYYFDPQDVEVTSGCVANAIGANTSWARGFTNLPFLLFLGFGLRLVRRSRPKT